jgi:hypothetical protein
MQFFSLMIFRLYCIRRKIYWLIHVVLHVRLVKTFSTTVFITVSLKSKCSWTFTCLLRFHRTMCHSSSDFSSPLTLWPHGKCLFFCWIMVRFNWSNINCKSTGENGKRFFIYIHLYLFTNITFLIKLIFSVIIVFACKYLLKLQLLLSLNWDRTEKSGNMDPCVGILTPKYIYLLH